MILSTPVAITPTGELVWVGSGGHREGLNYNGVASQVRVVGDKVFVMGHRNSFNSLDGPSVYTYSAIDGKRLALTWALDSGWYNSAVSCNADCTKGAAIYSNSGGLHLQEFDLVANKLVGAPVDLGPWQTSNYGPSALFWREGTSYFATQIPQTANGTFFHTNRVSPGVGWTGQDHVEPSGPRFYEPTIVATDDGYALAASTVPTPGPAVPADFRTVGTHVWNIAHDGTIRSSFPLADSGHSPRLAYKNGKLAISYVTLQSEYQQLDSRQLRFLECPK